MTPLNDESHVLTFNKLLQWAGIEKPEDVKLYRHTDAHFNIDESSKSIYYAWQNPDNRKRFEEYQNCQTKRNFNRPYLASFIKKGLDAVFVGLYKIDGEPVQNPETGYFDYNLTYLPVMKEFEGRLVTSWKTSKNPVRKAENENCVIKLYLENMIEEKFPGFDDFFSTTNEIKHIPSHWISPLSNMQGVYLLTCQDTGKQYVGSAKGKDGFYQRWISYTDGKDGGNKGMRKHTASGYQISILQAFPKSDIVDDALKKETIEKIEHRWMKKLGTIEHGLNTAWES